ncbi:MAG: hypothetical protein AAFR90_13635 [Pseudomonadota bacterium]
MTVRMQNWLAAFAFSVAAAGSAMAGVEAPVELDKVPTKIMGIAQVTLSGLKLTKIDPATIDDDSVIDDDSIVVVYEPLGEVKVVSANTETEDDGSMVYEIQGTTQDGRKIEIDIEPNGKIEEIEIEFKIGDVPGAVLKAVEKKLPGFKPEFIEASHTTSMHVISYEFVGQLGENKMDIEVSADGKNIVIADQ